MNYVPKKKVNMNLSCSMTSVRQNKRLIGNYFKNCLFLGKSCLPSSSGGLEVIVFLLLLPPFLPGTVHAGKQERLRVHNVTPRGAGTPSRVHSRMQCPLNF